MTHFLPFPFSNRSGGGLAGWVYIGSSLEAWQQEMKLKIWGQSINNERHKL